MRSAHDSENRVTIRSNVKQALPIVWCRGGEYMLIPKEIVQNAIDSVVIYNKMANKQKVWPVVCIYWDQGIPITNQAGRILTGKEEDGSGTTDNVKQTGRPDIVEEGTN